MATSGTIDSLDREGRIEAGQGPGGPLTPQTEKEKLRMARDLGNKWDP